MFDDTVRPGLSNVKPMMSGERIIMAVCDKKANTRTSASVYAERTIIAKLAEACFLSVQDRSLEKSKKLLP